MAKGTTAISKNIKKVAASMAIEQMYLSPVFIKELVKVEKGEKTTEELRREVIKKYAG